MNITEACESGYDDAEKHYEALDSKDGFSLYSRDADSLDRQNVHVLLDLSEEDWREQDMHEFQNYTGWNDAVEGWRRSPSLAVFFQAQKKGKRTKQDIIGSHCLLCAELNLSDLPNYCTTGGAPKPSYEISEVHFSKTARTPPDLAKKTQLKTLSSASSDELHSFSAYQKNLKSEPLVNKLLCRDEQSTNKSLTVCYYERAPCQMLKEKEVALSINSFSVLPPVKESRNQKSLNFFKKVELRNCSLAEEVTQAVVHSTTGVVTAGERVCINGDKGNVIKVSTDLILGDNSYQGSLSLKHWLSQYSNPMPSTFNITFQKYKLPFNTAANPFLQSTYPLGRNPRQEELTRSSPRNNTSNRLYSGHKARSLGGPEPQCLMLIGTRVPMPMSSQQIL